MRSMCAQSSMEVMGGRSVEAGGVVSRVGAGTLVEVGSPPPLMEGRWSAKEFVVILSGILCMMAGGHCEGSFSLGNCGEVLARLNPGRRACWVKGMVSKGRTLTMGVGPECARCEYPWL